MYNRFNFVIEILRIVRIGYSLSYALFFKFIDIKFMVLGLEQDLALVRPQATVIVPQPPHTPTISILFLNVFRVIVIPQHFF